jgi:hypothetical protein
LKKESGVNPNPHVVDDTRRFFERGISWSAKGWVAYQTEFTGMKNPDTWTKLQQYLNLDFIRSLFDPFIGR